MCKVSVIVPIYNVQEYLDECLASVVSQSIDSMQVILVDDGSTDASGAIAERYASTQANFEYHRIDNQGLGHARNYGASFAKGEYLCFLDSDDIVPPYAYEKMFDLGEKHRCDMVIGNVVRFNSSERFPSELHRRALSGIPEVSHISSQPTLFNDTIACNKLFRKDFYTRNNLRWAEGMLYEDIPVTIPAHVLANKVAHLDQVVYEWRVREGASASITQRRKELRNFQDRMKAISMVDAFFDEHVEDSDLHICKDLKWLDRDIRLYFNVLPAADDNYRATFVNSVSQYLERVHPEVYGKLRAIDRIAYHNIRTHNIDGLLASIEYARRGYAAISIRRNGLAEYSGVFPFSDIPRALSNMTEELRSRDLQVRVHSIISSPDTVEILGEAVIPRLPVARKSSASIEFELVDGDNVSIRRFTGEITKATPGRNLRLSRKYRNIHVENQRYRGYRLTIDREVLDSLAPGDYHIELSYALNGLLCEKIRVGDPANETAAHPQAILLDGAKVAFCYNTQGELCIQKRLSPHVVTAVHSVRGNSLVVETTSEITEVDICRLTSDPRWMGCRDAFPLDCFVTAPLWLPFANEDSLLRVSSNSYGELTVDQCPSAPIIETARFSGSRLVVELNCSFCGDATITNLELYGTHHGQTALLTREATTDDERLFAYSIDLSSNAANSLREDRYHLLAQLDSRSDNKPQHAKALCGFDISAFGVRIKLGGYEYSLPRCEGTFYLDVIQNLPWYENAKIKRKMIELFVYPIFRLIPLDPKMIVFESSWGNKTDCNPGALYEFFDQQHPEYRCVWSLSDTRMLLKGNAKRVRRESLSYYLAMARTKFLVNNVNFSDSYIKRAGQIEIQTMHGTPLKTLGLDVPGELESDEERKRFLKRRARWDYLIVQSPAAEKITSSCYAYDKEFLRTGYPRNDSLFRRNTESSIEEIRRTLGIPAGKTFVLYAPTWRVRNVFDLELDFRQLQEILGDEYVFALRVHQFALPGFDESCLPERVINVSHLGCIEDLLLAADVLITDYSSVMFDYALLKKPLLFYTYDLEEYRDQLRGFTIDLEAEAPGPLLADTAAVGDALLDLDATISASREAFDAFYHKYCSYETGHACESVYRSVFLRNGLESRSST